MRHEKIIERDDKRIKICVMVSIGSNDKIPYKTSVQWSEKNKRTWHDVTEDSRDFRKLSSEEKQKVDLQNQLSLVSEQELLDAKIEAWQKIKPCLSTGN
jgi:hypothetical protein